jgi:2-keto-3-deoxy-L-rhamnonate aldolase RhmA
LTPIVRVPQNSSEWISKALDGGAQAVIVPHINSAEEAARVVRCAKFTPIGERSATSGMPILRYANIPAQHANVVANELTTVICMIETQHAVDHVESVCADLPLCPMRRLPLTRC